MANTVEQFNHITSVCRELFVKKLKDYGASWRIMRPTSITDQILSKQNAFAVLKYAERLW